VGDVVLRVLWIVFWWLDSITERHVEGVGSFELCRPDSRWCRDDHRAVQERADYRQLHPTGSIYAAFPPVQSDSGKVFSANDSNYPVPRTLYPIHGEMWDGGAVLNPTNITAGCMLSDSASTTATQIARYSRILTWRSFNEQGTTECQLTCLQTFMSPWDPPGKCERAQWPVKQRNKVKSRRMQFQSGQMRRLPSSLPVEDAGHTQASLLGGVYRRQRPGNFMVTCNTLRIW
jgi:hypothetical protein